jgi:hypothetical protein
MPFQGGDLGVGVILGAKDYRRMVLGESSPPVALWPLDFLVGGSDFDSSVTGAPSIATSGSDWTITQNGGPNGDNCATPDGAMAASSASGATFVPSYGSGSEAFSVVLAIRTSGVTVGSTIVGVYDSGSASVALWRVALLSDETLNFELQNDAGGAYLSLTTSSIGTSDVWSQFVFVAQTGSTRSLAAYKNNASDGSTSSTSGTARSSVTDPRLYLGTDGAASNDVPSTVDLMMVGFYDYALSADDIERHYLHLFAS